MMAEPQAMPTWATAWIMILHGISTLLGLVYVILKLLRLERKVNGHLSKHKDE